MTPYDFIAKVARLRALRSARRLRNTSSTSAACWPSRPRPKPTRPARCTASSGARARTPAATAGPTSGSATTSPGNTALQRPRQDRAARRAGRDPPAARRVGGSKRVETLKPNVDFPTRQEDRTIITPALERAGQNMIAASARLPKFIHDPQHPVDAQAVQGRDATQQPVSGEQDSAILTSCRHQTETIVRRELGVRGLDRYQPRRPAWAVSRWSRAHHPPEGSSLDPSNRAPPRVESGAAPRTDTVTST